MDGGPGGKPPAANRGDGRGGVSGADPLLQQAKLTASDGAAGGWFRTSAAISGDTVVVGVLGHDISVDSHFVWLQVPRAHSRGLVGGYGRLRAHDNGLVHGGATACMAERDSPVGLCDPRGGNPPYGPTNLPGPGSLPAGWEEKQR